MAITFAQLQDLLKKEGNRYFIAPGQPLIRFTGPGRFGHYDIAIFLMDQGMFFQFQTIGYLRCAADHPHLKAVFQTLSAINYEMRYLKLGWNPASGEIAGYGDGWVKDNQVTQQQFHQMLGNFLPGIDMSFPRIWTAVQTGRDPSTPPPPDPQPQRPGPGEPALPPHLRALLDWAEQGSEGRSADHPFPGGAPEITEI